MGLATGCKIRRVLLYYTRLIRLGQGSVPSPMPPTAAATRASGCNQLAKRAGGKENSDQRTALHRYQDTCETMYRGKGAGNGPFMGRVMVSRLCQNENAMPFYLGWPPLNNCWIHFLFPVAWTTVSPVSYGFGAQSC